MKYGFIGCGNMGGALVRCARLAKQDGTIYITDRHPEKTGPLSAETAALCVDAKTAAREADYIFLGVKPQVMGQLFSEIKETLDARKDRFVLVSMAAGLSVSRIRDMAGDHPIIRIMPNLAVSAGAGMTLYCAENCTEEELAGFLEVMKCSGELLAIKESLIDAASAVSGCGPAFVCLFAEALADGGVAAGIPREKALLLAEQTILGTAKLLLQTGRHPAEVKDAVCSPGGTTIAGVLALEEGGFRATAASAVEASYKKTLKLV